MNRVQKSKSLYIKQIMRSSKWPITYKEAKRQLRRRERKTKRAAEFYRKHCREEV